MDEQEFERRRQELARQLANHRPSPVGRVPSVLGLSRIALGALVLIAVSGGFSWWMLILPLLGPVT